MNTGINVVILPGKQLNSIQPLAQSSAMDREVNWKKGKTRKLGYRKFNRTENEGKAIVMIKQYKKQLMHNAIAHYPLTSAQPVACSGP